MRFLQNQLHLRSETRRMALFGRHHSASSMLGELHIFIYHIRCVLFKKNSNIFIQFLSTDCPQNGEEDEGIDGFLENDIHAAIEAAAKFKCTKCNEPGANINCCVPKCQRRYHLPCALVSGCLPQYRGEFPMFCPSHAIRYGPSKGTLEHNTVCLICRDRFESKSRVFRAPTCCLDLWVHRACMQEYALRFGLLTKCMACDKKTDEYQDLLRDWGIAVPYSDPYHPVEEAIRVELTQTPCQADVCWCTHESGRTYSVKDDQSKWFMLKCKTCGSGIHLECKMKVGGDGDDYECVRCVAINAEIVQRATADQPRDDAVEPVDSLMEPDIYSGINNPQENNNVAPKSHLAMASNIEQICQDMEVIEIVDRSSTGDIFAALNEPEQPINEQQSQHQAQWPTDEPRLEDVLDFDVITEKRLIEIRKNVIFPLFWASLRKWFVIPETETD